MRRASAMDATHAAPASASTTSAWTPSENASSSPAGSLARPEWLPTRGPPSKLGVSLLTHPAPQQQPFGVPLLTTVDGKARPAPSYCRGSVGGGVVGC